MKASYRRVESFLHKQNDQKTISDISNAANETKNFSPKLLITNNTEKILICTNQSKAKDFLFFIYFQCLIVGCTKQTENK